MKNLTDDSLINKSVLALSAPGTDKYFQLFDQYPNPVLIINPNDFSIKEVNKAASALYGLNRKRFLELNLADLDPTLNDKSKAQISKLYSHGKFVTRHKVKDGVINKVEIRSIPFSEGEQIFYSLFVTSSGFDETSMQKSGKQKDSKGNEAQSEKNNSQLSLASALIESIPGPVLIRNENKIFASCNTAFEKLLGYNRNFMVNKDVGELFDAETASRIDKLDKQVFSKKRLSFGELSFAKEDGTEKKYFVSSNPVYHNRNKISFIINVFTDVTMNELMKNSEKVFSEKEKQLNELKLRFLSTSSHEFRTPLTTILTSSELLLMIGRTLSEEKYVDYIYQIQNAVNYMTSLLDDILTINKTEVGKWKFSPSKIDLYDFLQKMVEETRNNATPQHNIILDFKLKDNNAIVDNKLLQHILSNLLSNAVKYSPDGGNIVLKVKALKSDLEFTVADNGIGISKKDQKNLFETFYRGRNTGKIEGTGLGLSIVKRCVESHGGKLSFKSNLNEGSTFTISIPMMTIV